MSVNSIPPLQPHDPSYIDTLPPEILSYVFTFTESNAAESFVSKKFHQSSRDESLCKYFFCQLHSIVGEDLPDFECLIDKKEGDSWLIIKIKAITYFNDLRKKTDIEPIVIPKQKDYFSTSLISIYRKTYQMIMDRNFNIFCEKINTDIVDLALLRKDLNENKFQGSILNLKNRGLTLFPLEICALTTLSGLNLRKNQLRNLPPCLSKLVNLTHLDMSRNPLKKIPSSISRLNSLVTLILGDNVGIIFPKTFGNLTKLTTLHFRNNQLQNLPQTFSVLENLTELDLGGNPLEEFPSCLLGLSNLRTLSFETNELGSGVNREKLPKSMNFPKTFAKLTNLTRLSFGGTLIKNLPESLGSLVNLTELDFTSTKIEDLPQCIYKLTNLKSLNIEDTPLKEKHQRSNELSFCMPHCRT